MARKRKSYGSTSAVHVHEAGRLMNSVRHEEAVIRSHLAAGQCRPAIHGLMYLGWQAGKAAAHKASTTLKRQGRGRHVNKLSARVRRLAEKVSAQCLR